MSIDINVNVENFTRRMAARMAEDIRRRFGKKRVPAPVSAMRMTPLNGYLGCDVIDSDGSKIQRVAWVDDTTQQYACFEEPARYVGYELAVIVKSVTGVRVDHADKKIYINSGIVSKVACLLTVAPEIRTVRPCTECRQEETCRRISYCAAFKCGFGEDDAP